jgi:hypothetical protein
MSRGAGEPEVADQCPDEKWMNFSEKKNISCLYTNCK